MLLARHTDYSVRVLMHAVLHEDETVTIGESARNLPIPRNHSMKIARRLEQLGYVHSARGKGENTYPAPWPICPVPTSSMGARHLRV